MTIADTARTLVTALTELAASASGTDASAANAMVRALTTAADVYDRAADADPGPALTAARAALSRAVRGAEKVRTGVAGPALVWGTGGSPPAASRERIEQASRQSPVGGAVRGAAAAYYAAAQAVTARTSALHGATDALTILIADAEKLRTYLQVV
jgi:hypothetical protein